MRPWICVCLALTAACGPEQQELPPDAPTEGTRVDLPIVEFDEWTDYIALQGAVDADCRFMDPLFDNDSTAWPPLQVFWVIYDKESDVKDGDRVEDTFFVGDVVRATDFGSKGGLDALGFKFLPPLQQSFLNIEEMNRSDGGRTLEALLGSPIDSWIRLTATDAADGTCTLQTDYCEEPCAGDWAPFSSIYLELGTFLAVQSIEYRQ